MFLETIDLDNHDFCRTLFSFKKCERPLREHDHDQLGLQNDQLVNKLRFYGLLIDGTVAGVLSELPDLSLIHI